MPKNWLWLFPGNWYCSARYNSRVNCGRLLPQTSSTAARISTKKYSLLKELESAIWQVQFHPQQLAAVVANPVWFKYEISKFMVRSDRLKEVINTLDNVIENNSNQLVVNPEILQTVLQNYNQTWNSYAQLMEGIWQGIDPVNLQPEDILFTQQKVLAINTENKAIEIRVQFERLSESLNQLIAIVEKQQNQANQRFVRSEILRIQIIIGSMVLSVAIAACLAYYTSRAIARPLKALTETAQRVTAESDLVCKLKSALLMKFGY